ncbi:MAG: AAA family ATPase [Thermodesulfovibrionia bacterium]|nr:AAA family ATPase [Thermodesulfovibrionia bacterium]
MNLVSFSVQNYRSITKTHKLKIKDSTILIGPNNEGKSNILKALVVVLSLISRLGALGIPGGRVRRLPSHRRHYSHYDYDWDRDFPISLREENPDGKSIFNLEFQLTPEEISEFRQEVKSSLSGTLPIQITIGKDANDFKVKKQGPGKHTLSNKSTEITHFIGKRLDFQYIPAIRTAQSTQNIVEDMVARELMVVESDPMYIEALDKIEAIQKPILDRISLSIKETLTEFLPAVKDVHVIVSQEKRYQALRHSCDINVDDGTATLLQDKGDGVQSLAALSLMRHVAERGAKGRHLILAIEEPESHLHPNAIHQLKRVLNEMSSKHQIIMTSHNPLFVDRYEISSNIIVTENKAAPAKSISVIRDILGVRASDNLRNAELVLIVEGEDDRIALSSLLSFYSGNLKESLHNGTLAIDSLLGGANLSYKLSQIRDVLCDSYVFLDHDKSGIDSSIKAKTEGLLTDADLTFTICQGMSESEIEDIYKVDAYKGMVNNRYKVELTSAKFRTNKKWSDRMKETFRFHGKHWDDSVEKRIKAEVADIIAANPADALNSHKRSAFDALVTALENKLSNLKIKNDP